MRRGARQVPGVWRVQSERWLVYSLLLVSLVSLATLAGLPPIAAAAGQTIRIESIEPARIDSALVCTVRMVGLPDEASRETLASGLPSAMTMAFSLIDERGRERQVSQVEIRLDPDLWENVLILRTPLIEHRVAAIDDVVRLLAALGPLPVAPMTRLPGGFVSERRAAVRLRARLAIHPLAPTEFRRVSELFGADAPASDPDRREVSVGLGTLFRYFLGERSGERWVTEATSAAFTWLELAAPPVTSGNP